MTERIRWKQKHDARAVENDLQRSEIALQAGALVVANNRIVELEREIDAAKDRLATAKLEGMDCAVQGFKQLLQSAQ